MKKVFSKPSCMIDREFHYCPGCGHSIVHRMVGELIDEFQLREKFIGIAPVGCSVFAYYYFDVDFLQAAHGRAPAVATGVKRVHPNCFVLSYQGDGDLAAIGTAEIIHAANRGENITVVFINNAIYGMTGGQMAPTTLVGQKSATTPRGRNPENEGYPIKICEMLSTLKAPAYIARVSLDSTKNIIKTKKALKKAFEMQINNKGFSLVEILSPCPTNWGKSPEDAMKWIASEMAREFPLGEFKTPEN